MNSNFPNYECTKCEYKIKFSIACDKKCDTYTCERCGQPQYVYKSILIRGHNPGCKI